MNKNTKRQLRMMKMNLLFLKLYYTHLAGE